MRVLQSQGQLKLTPAGFFWKKTGGGAGKTVELPLKGEGRARQTCPTVCAYTAPPFIADKTGASDNSLTADIENFVWTKVSRGCQLGVKRKSGATVNFTGFRDQVSTFVASNRL